ncbi:MAG: replicative DNA helicase [Pseudomonadota bacterium]
MAEIDSFSVPPVDRDAAVDALRVPPHSIEAEQSVLGGVMLSPSAWERVDGVVVETDFYRHDHQLVFRALKSLAEQEQPLDVVTVAEWLQQRDQLEEVGGLVFLNRLAADTPSAGNVKAYAEIVRERSVLRQMISVANDVADAGYHPNGRDSRELLDFAESRVLGIADQVEAAGGGFRGIAPILADTIDRIDELYSSGSTITGLPTGFSEFDQMTSGLQPSDLIIVAGRPSMGKTTFCMNIAENAAIQAEQPVAIFSMEMPGEQLAMRMISSLSMVELQKIRTGALTDADWPRITSAVALISERKIFIDDSPGLSPTEVRARARRLKREHGLGLIVLDYLQLMQIKGSSSDNRTAEISEISRSLKSLAKELNVPVIALSQLNRSLEQRTDKRPVMSDLRESGAIEQDADVIVFIYRDEVYNPESPDKGTAEILIRKQRNGPIGSTRVAFMGQFTRFDNYSPEYMGVDY